MLCRFYENGSCRLAAELSGTPVSSCPVLPATCSACLAITPEPSIENPSWLAVSVALNAARKAGDEMGAIRLRNLYSQVKPGGLPGNQPPEHRGSKPFLTIGMATYDDFDGVYLTLQSLMLYHRDMVPMIEVIVIDNHPNSKHGRSVRNLVEGWFAKNGSAGARYIPMETPTGTTQPRQRVFDEAAGDVVLCIDSHVMLAPGAVRGLISFAQKYPENRDLWQGPMLYDDGNIGATHMEPVWRGEMFGTWAVDERGTRQNGEPFEIPMHGLGLFACRRDAWPGFHPEFRGFGGEEGYLHRKFQADGRKTLCLPFLRWLHRFGRPDGVPYRLDNTDRVRNYLLGSKELGIPVEDIHAHFVDTGKLSRERFNALHIEVFGQPFHGAPTTVSEPKEFPSPLRIGWNLAKAVGRHWLTGARKLESEEVAARLDVCRGCELVTLNGAGEPSRCTSCGCYLQVKATWASETCPLSKWPELTPATDTQAVPS